MLKSSFGLQPKMAAGHVSENALYVAVLLLQLSTLLRSLQNFEGSGTGVHKLEIRDELVSLPRYVTGKMS